MVRFIEIFDAANCGGARKLNLSDMGLGDLSMRVIAEIISQNKHSQLDLSKNVFTDLGLKIIADAVSSSRSVMSIILNAN